MFQKRFPYPPPLTINNIDGCNEHSGTYPFLDFFDIFSRFNIVYLANEQGKHVLQDDQDDLWWKIHDCYCLGYCGSLF